MLLLALGLATGCASSDNAFRDSLLRLVNSIERGNPEFTPYEV